MFSEEMILGMRAVVEERIEREILNVREKRGDPARITSEERRIVKYVAELSVLAYKLGAEGATVDVLRASVQARYKSMMKRRPELKKWREYLEIELKREYRDGVKYGAF